METSYEEMSLRNLGAGAATELFDEELRGVLENIGDPNTPADALREVVLKIRPNSDRSAAAVEIHATSKLAPVKPVETHVFMGMDGDRVRAYENNPRQPNLPNVTPIEEGRG